MEYICKVERLLMHSPAVILRKGQKLVVDTPSVEILKAIADGSLEELDKSMSKPSSTANTKTPAVAASSDTKTKEGGGTKGSKTETTVELDTRKSVTAKTKE